MLVYDVEVLHGPEDTEGGWANPFGMGFGCAAVYNPDMDQYFLFGLNQEDALILMLSGAMVVSFNGIRFDNKVLLGNDYQSRWTDYDLFQEIAKAKFKENTFEDVVKNFPERELHNGTMNLDALCKNTIGRGKTGHGADAPKLIRDGKWAEAFQYNINDVKLTWELLKHIKRYGYVVDGNHNYVKMEMPSVRTQGGK